MKDHRIKKILGNRLYAVYRRMRYLRYLKSVEKKRRRKVKVDQLSEDQQYRYNLRKQKKLERKQARAYKKRMREERRQLKKEQRAALRKQIRRDRINEQKKRRLEREELKQLRIDAKKSITELSQEEKKLEKHRQKQLLLERKQEKQQVKARLREKLLLEKELNKKRKQAQKTEKRERRRRLRELRPYLIKRRRREILYALRKVNAASLKRGMGYLLGMITNKSERNLFLKVAINSTSLFVLSYLTLYILSELITLYAAQSFNYDTILFYYKIYYNIDSDQWNADAVKVLFSIKPLAGLVIGTIAIIIFSSLKNMNGLFKLYFLWLFVHGMVMFFGSLLLGTLLNQGFGWVIAYLYYKDTGKMVFSIIAIFALVITGSSVARSFLISGNTYFNHIGRENRKFLLIGQVLIPVVLGTTITALLKVPTDLYYTTSEEVIFEILKLTSIFIVTIPILVSFSSSGTIFFDEDTRRPRFGWLYILITLLVFFGYRTLFLHGMVIGY